MLLLKFIIEMVENALAGESDLKPLGETVKGQSSRAFEGSSLRASVGELIEKNVCGEIGMLGPHHKGAKAQRKILRDTLPTKFSEEPP